MYNCTLGTQTYIHVRMFICTLGTYLCAHDVSVCMRRFNYCCLSQMHATNIFAVFAVFFLTALLQRCTVNCSSNSSSRDCDAPKTGLTCVQVCMRVSERMWVRLCLPVCKCCTALHCTVIPVCAAYLQSLQVYMRVSETMWVSASVCVCAPLLSRYAQLPLLSLERLENERNSKGMRGSNLRHNNNSCLQYWPFTVRGRLPFCEFNIFFCLLFALCFFFLHFVFIEGFRVHSLLPTSVTNSAVYYLPSFFNANNSKYLAFFLLHIYNLAIYNQIWLLLQHLLHRANQANRLRKR